MRSVLQATDLQIADVVVTEILELDPATNITFRHITEELGNEFSTNRWIWDQIGVNFL